MYDSILVPTDGSDTAGAAIDLAVDLATRFDATVHALHVVEIGDLTPGGSDDLVDELRGRGEASVAEVEAAAANAGVECGTDVVGPQPRADTAIVDYAIDNGIDCIIMGTHGRTGLKRLALGSVAERTLRLSPVPVLTVHEGGTLDETVDAVLVPTDGSAGANAAADHAIDLARATGAALHVVHVVDPSTVGYDVGEGAVLAALQDVGQQAVDDTVDRAEEAGVGTVEASVLSGSTPRSIADYAADRDVDCIVMGTHGRTGVDRLLLGSVTERLIRLTDAPVIGVKSPPVAEAAVVTRRGSSETAASDGTGA